MTKLKAGNTVTIIGSCRSMAGELVKYNYSSYLSGG